MDCWLHLSPESFIITQGRNGRCHPSPDRVNKASMDLNGETSIGTEFRSNGLRSAFFTSIGTSTLWMARSVETGRVYGCINED